MAVLTTDIEIDEKPGEKLDLPMAVDIVFRGAILKVNAAGFIAPAAAEVGAKMAGMAYEKVDNSTGSAGDVSVKVIRRGVHRLTGVSFTQADVGELVYASDDQTVSTTQGTNEQEVGTIVALVSSTQIDVDIDRSVSGGL